MSESLIYKKICEVAKEVGAIGKDAQNIQQNFRYRGVDMVMNALHPAFVKHSVFVTPKILDLKRENRQTQKGGNLTYTIATIEYTFYAEDGSSVIAVVVGEAMDSADKSTNKAMSVAFKYACFQVFCIPTEEVEDPDEDSYDVKPTSAPICGVCGKEVSPIKQPNGAIISADDVYKICKGKCYSCASTMKGTNNNDK